MPTLYAQTLRRAVEIAGGIKQLGTRLGLPETVLEDWLLGMQPIPPDIFLQAVDIVSAKGIDEESNVKITPVKPSDPSQSHS